MRKKTPHGPIPKLRAAANVSAQTQVAVADLPLGIDGKPDPTGIPIGETIRRIEQTGSWAALKNIEHVPEYAALLVSFGLPEGFAHVLADSDVQAGKGALEDNSRTLSRLIGRATTPMADVVKAAL